MQWTATIPGDIATEAILDLDRVGDRLKGYVLLVYQNGGLLDLAWLDLAADVLVHHVSVTFQPILPGSLEPIPPEQLKLYYPDGYAKSAQVKFEFGIESLGLTWTDNFGMTGELSVPNSKANEPSDLIAISSITTWEQFKNHTSSIPPDQYIFRGQARDWRLRTSYHRTGRSNLVRYVHHDLPRTHRAIIGKTRHLFNRQIPDENAAFIHLLQHHGFPTPLLDWSESPFIAAFFAFHGERRDTEDAGPVRILVFAKRDWAVGINQLTTLSLIGPHLSIVEPLGIENDRAMPQQALSTVTNVDDIETYVRRWEKANDAMYLVAIDLPYEERVKALRDLAMMGITAGSMYPGLDGICQQMTDRLFGYGAS